MANILASKLFISSVRQDKILAAIQDPMNKELVQQLREYLDEDFIDPSYLNDDTEVSNEPDVSDTQESHSSKGDSHASVPHRMGGRFSSNSDSSITPGENYENDEDDLSQDDTGDDSSDGSDSSLTDSSDLGPEIPIDDIEEIDSAVNINIPLDQIKGLLNSREDSKGVIRVAEKDSELWVYYNDDTNLNTVMTACIELLASSGYSYLEFNRLARSNNAIVFDILRQSIDSYEGDSSDKK